LNTYFNPKFQVLWHITSGGKRRFFAPDEEKRAAFLRAQKNVAEQNPQRAQARLGFA